MYRIFKKAFNISIENLTLSTPLLVFLMFNVLYYYVSKIYVTTLPLAILFVLITIFLTSIFLAGWFKMVKVAIYNFKNGISYNKASQSFALLKDFSVGVSEYFFPYLKFTVLTIVLFNIVICTAFLFCEKVIGNVGFTLSDFIEAFSSHSTLLAFLSSLTNFQLVKFYEWSVIISTTMVLYSILTLFWPMEILYTTKNVVNALLLSVKDVFRKPQIIWLFVIIILLNNIFVMLNVFSMINPIVLFFMTLLYFYFIVYIFVLLFLYYEEKIKSNRNSITDSNR